MRILLLQVSGLIERKDVVRVCAIRVILLVEEEQALAGLTGPCNDGVCGLGLLAAKVQVEILRGHGSVVEPELFLGGDERPAVLSVTADMEMEDVQGALT